MKIISESPCETENGGCSHDCLDRGDGQAVCSCPCGYFLDVDKVSGRPSGSKLGTKLTFRLIFKVGPSVNPDGPLLSPFELILIFRFQKTCHRSNVCPYDFSFWLDGSDNACNDANFDALQREKSQLLMSFFTAYVRDDEAKMAASFWAEDALTHSIGNYHTENTSIQFLKDQIQERILICSRVKIGIWHFSK